MRSLIITQTKNNFDILKETYNKIIDEQFITKIIEKVYFLITNEEKNNLLLYKCISNNNDNKKLIKNLDLNNDFIESSIDDLLYQFNKDESVYFLFDSTFNTFREKVIMKLRNNNIEVNVIANLPMGD